MSQVHTVKQGETLTRIAKQYNYSSWKSIYDHASNGEFRKLRPNPNLIYPGDQVNIPDIEPKEMSVATSKKHVFCLQKDLEFFRVKIQTPSGEPLTGKRVVLEVGSQKLDAAVGEDGVVEVDLPNGDEAEAVLKVFMEPDAEAPSHELQLQLGRLDPFDTLSGVQGRCNALGHDCGEVDGVMGPRTRAGVESFQKRFDLTVDGEPGPITKDKLRSVYGC